MMSFDEQKFLFFNVVEFINPFLYVCIFFNSSRERSHSQPELLKIFSYIFFTNVYSFDFLNFHIHI